MFAPETLTAPAPIVKAEVFATFPCRVTVPVSTVKAVVRVAFVTVAALPVQEAALPVVFWLNVGKLFVPLIKVLFVSVCVSVVPTTAPVGSVGLFAIEVPPLEAFQSIY